MVIALSRIKIKGSCSISICAASPDVNPAWRSTRVMSMGTALFLYSGNGRSVSESSYFDGNIHAAAHVGIERRST